MSAFWIVLILVGILVLGFLHRYQFIPRLEQRLMKGRDKRIKELEDLNKEQEETILSLTNSNEILTETINNQQVEISTLTAERHNQNKILEQMNRRAISFQNTLNDPVACLERAQELLLGMQKNAARGGKRCRLRGCLIQKDGTHAGINGARCPVTTLGNLILATEADLARHKLTPKKNTHIEPPDTGGFPCGAIPAGMSGVTIIESPGQEALRSKGQRHWADDSH